MKTFSTLLTACLISLWCGLLIAQPVGVLDPSFGQEGQTLLELNTQKSQVQAIELQKNGDLLVAGSPEDSTEAGFTMSRLNTFGIPDKHFGEDGKVTFYFPGEIRDLSLQPDNKILVTGFIKQEKDRDFFVLRLHPDGKPDLSFGKEGWKIVNLGGTDEAWQVHVQTDGKIIVAGNTFAQSWIQRDFGLIRLHPNGQLDHIFANGGIKRIDIGKYDHFRDLVIQEDGHIVVAGYSKPDKFHQFALFRIDPQGQLDPAFDIDGVKFLHFGLDNDFCESIALQNDGKIIVAGHARMNRVQYGLDFVVARLFPSGNLDQSFGTRGFTTLDLGGAEYARNLCLQPDGNIILAGTSNYEITAVRLSDEGNLDYSFGNKGRQIIRNGANSSGRVSNLLVEPNGKILISGVCKEEAILARITGNPALPGLKEVMNFSWEVNRNNEERYAKLDLGVDFNLEAWTAGEIHPQPIPGLAARSGMQAFGPEQTYIVRQAYFKVGEQFKLAAIWDSQDLIHCYVNGKFVKTFSLQLSALNPILSAIDQENRKPLPVSSQDGR